MTATEEKPTTTTTMKRKTTMTAASTLALVLFWSSALPTSRANSVPYGVESLADLYRLQQLYQLSEGGDLQREDPYLALLPIDGIDGRSDETMMDPASIWGAGPSQDAGQIDEDEESLYNSPLFTGAQARDEEHMQHSALQGIHQVAGGTAEGEPPQKQVKSDKPLPAYCNPPNPCPVGKTAADNCVENFENSMDNNKKLLQEQDCPCDTEHMWSCPAGQQTVTSKGTGGQAALSKVMNELAQLHSGMDSNNPYLSPGMKREKLVAKKSAPGFLRKKRSQEQGEFNPFLDGQEKMPRAAKKSPEISVLPGK